MTLKLDHIVVGARSRMDGAAHVARATGAELGMGGAHPALGTHNMLCQLGADVFLESISPDPKAPRPGRARWYGLDTPPEPPRLCAWVINTDNMADTLGCISGLGHDAGQPLKVERGDLTWRFALRDDGAAALGGAAPHIIQWDRPAPHPAAAMADAGLTLDRLTVTTPQADALEALLDSLKFSDNRVVVAHGETLHLAARLRRPDGRTVTLT